VTPATAVAKKAGIAHRIHEYTHDPAAESYGAEAAASLGVPEERVFKTLVVSLDGRELVVAAVPVADMLSMKQLARAAGARKASMASPAEVERSTGYVLGGVSPLGQKKSLRTFIDDSAAQFDTVYVSAGRRGLEIELAPADLLRLARGTFAPLVHRSQ